MLGTVWAAWHVVPYMQAHRNLCWLLFPDEYLDPQLMGLAMSGVAVCVVIVWGPQTLAKSRFT